MNEWCLPNRLQQADRMVALQDASGHWHTILNREDSYLEPSVAAMFTAGVQRAIELTMLSPEYQLVVDAAWQAVRSNLQPGGRYPGSDVTDIGDFSYYNTLPSTINPWCIGPACWPCVGGLPGRQDHVQLEGQDGRFKRRAVS